MMKIPSNRVLISSGRLSGWVQRSKGIKYQKQAYTFRYPSRRMTSPGMNRSAASVHRVKVNYI